MTGDPIVIQDLVDGQVVFVSNPEDDEAARKWFPVSSADGIFFSEFCPVGRQYVMNVETVEGEPELVPRMPRRG